MKVVLCLLFVCALQGTSYARSHFDGSLFVATRIDTERLDIIQSLKEIIDFVTKSAIDIANKLRDQIKQLYEDIVNAINNIKEQAENAINEVESQLHEILQTIGHGVNCVDQAAEEVESIISEARSGAQQCRAAASKEVESLYTDLKQYSDSIQKEVGKIGDVISECINENNTLEAATCTISNLRTITESITNIFNDGKEAIKLGSEQIKEIALDANVCSAKVVETARQKSEEIAESIKQCIIDS